MFVGPSKEKNKRKEMALAIRLVAEMKKIRIKASEVKADAPLEGAKRTVIILFPNRFSAVPSAIVQTKRVLYQTHTAG